MAGSLLIVFFRGSTFKGRCPQFQFVDGSTLPGLESMLDLAYSEVDGIRYCSSMYGNETAIAFFERDQCAPPQRPVFHCELKDPIRANILTEAAIKIRYELI